MGRRGKGAFLSRGGRGRVLIFLSFNLFPKTINLLRLRLGRELLGAGTRGIADIALLLAGDNLELRIRLQDEAGDR